MKKILPMLIIGLMFAFNAKAAEEVKTTVLYKLGDKTISYQVDASSSDGYVVNNFFVNNKQLFKVEATGYNNSKFILHKTNLKNLVVIESKTEEMGINRYLYVVDLNSSTYRLIDEAYENEITYKANSHLLIDGSWIKDVYSDNGCNKELLKKDIKFGVVKTTHPIIRGYSVNEKTIFKTKNISDLSCEIVMGDIGEKIVHVRESSKKFIGIASDLNSVYFSATGDGWTAYYAYDIKAGKINKTTLTKINKDKMKLTLVKKF